jgi:CubicO group peptidase (beta-lactamase class C family)
LFTATLLADLAAEGMVGLGDPVAAHLPAAPPVRGRPITLEDLATHHSGLPRLPAGMVLRGLTLERGDPFAGLDDERMMRAIRETAPKRAPGTRFAYSNYGVGLLGYALARAAGTTYAELVTDRITRPLGLDDTAVTVPAGAERRLAPGHGWWGRPAGRWDLAGLVGAGGLVSTAVDLLRFLDLFRPDAGSALARAAAETARTRYDVNRMLGVGLGWVVLSGGHGPRRARLTHDVLMHDGGTGGYRSFAAVAPATGTAVVVLSGRARGVSGLGLRLARAVV